MPTCRDALKLDVPRSSASSFQLSILFHCAKPAVLIFNVSLMPQCCCWFRFVPAAGSQSSVSYADGHSTIPAYNPVLKVLRFWWSYYNSSLYTKYPILFSKAISKFSRALMVILQFQCAILFSKFSDSDGHATIPVSTQVSNPVLKAIKVFSCADGHSQFQCAIMISKLWFWWSFSIPVSWCASTLLATGVLTPIVLALWAWLLCGPCKGRWVFSFLQYFNHLNSLVLQTASVRHWATCRLLE